jgi:hypothetical protein
VKNFYQFLEALSSHGGFTMPHGDQFKPTLNKRDTEYVTGMYKRPLVISSRGKLRGGIIAVLDTVLSRVEDFNFHIYFGGYARTDMNINRYFFDVKKIPKEDIVFLKKSSQGELLTAWMILHNMGHAVFQTGNKSSEDAIKMAVFILVKNLTFNETPFTTVTTVDKMDNVDDEDLSLSISFKPNEILPLLFNFASAKATVRDAEELVYEIFAYYLYCGGKLKRPDFKKLITFCNQKFPVKHTENYVSELVENSFTKIEKEIKKSLEYCRGKVLED